MSTLDQIRQAAAEEEAFFAEIRRQSRVSFHTFTRPSRSGGATHVMHIDVITLTPIDLDHPCSCKAGADGRFCWALLDVIANELPKLNSSPSVLRMAAEAQALIEARAEQSCKKGRRN